MRSCWPITLIVLAVWCPFTPAQGPQTEPKEECVRSCIVEAQELVEQSNREFTAGNVDAALASMHKSVNVAGRAANEVMDTHKRQKETEIALRRLSMRITDIAKTLNFEDREPVQRDARQIEDIRERLLNAMFDNPSSTLKPQEKSR